ncbi:hypothetical protein INT45_002973 [Circinella minor]|uniref:Uncharacterized protein n=1 Tax=Circinella minor TaxID=1195481 RepID=A0A8H7S808_9FUNG|nr:hypothetical protein INT45_002973 [Circinella minor]
MKFHNQSRRRYLNMGKYAIIYNLDDETLKKKFTKNELDELDSVGKPLIRTTPSEFTKDIYAYAHNIEHDPETDHLKTWISLTLVNLSCLFLSENNGGSVEGESDVMYDRWLFLNKIFRGSKIRATGFSALTDSLRKYVSCFNYHCLFLLSDPNCPTICPNNDIRYPNTCGNSLFRSIGLEEKIEEWRTRRRIEDSFFDVFDGDMWREFPGNDGAPFVDEHCSLLLTLNIDWFGPFLNSTYSVGAIYLTINNLPRSERFKTENVFLVGVMPGPREARTSDIKNYLQSLVDELLEWYGGRTIRTNIHPQGIGKEITSRASRSSRNGKRVISSIDPVEKVKMGVRVDTIYKGSDMEIGCLEIGHHDDPTKELTDSRLKLPTVMKEMFLDIFKYASELVHKIHIIAYNINGKNIQLLDMDCPFGYVLRIRRTRELPYPLSSSNFPKRIASMLELAMMGKIVMEETLETYDNFRIPLKFSRTMNVFPPCFSSTNDESSSSTPSSSLPKKKLE